MKPKYKFNHNYFSNIDTEDKAYFLGMMYADGNIGLNHNTKTVRLVNTDKEMLESFIEYIEGDNRIYEETHNVFKTKCYRVRLASSQMYDDLNALGCTPRKSLVLKYPIIPNRLDHHFIRGYFDGDGTVGLYKVKHSTWKRLMSGFCGTKEMLEEIRDISGLHNTIRKQKNIHVITFSCFKSMDLYRYMYKDATVYMKRKKIIFESYKQKRSTTIMGSPTIEG